MIDFRMVEDIAGEEPRTSILVQIHGEFNLLFLFWLVEVVIRFVLFVLFGQIQGLYLGLHPQSLWLL